MCVGGGGWGGCCCVTEVLGADQLFAFPVFYRAAEVDEGLPESQPARLLELTLGLGGSGGGGGEVTRGGGTTRSNLMVALGAIDPRSDHTTNPSSNEFGRQQLC